MTKYQPQTICTSRTLSATILAVNNHLIHRDSNQEVGYPHCSRHGGRVVSQNVVVCDTINNGTQSIPIEFLSDNLSKVSELEEQVGKLKDEIEWDNQLLQNAEEVKQRLQNEISNLKSDKESFNAEKSELENEISQLESDKEALNAEKSQLEHDIGEKQETIDMLWIAKRDLETEVNTLTNNNTALQQELESVSVNNGTSVCGITLVVNGEEASVTTLTRTSIDQLLYDNNIGTQEIWMWVKEKNENNQYYYNLIYKRVSSIEDIRQQFESTLSQDGSVYANTFSTTFSTGEDFVVTSLSVRLPYQGVFAMSIPMINVNLRTNDTVVLFTTSSLRFNMPKSDDPFVPEVGW